MPVMPEDAVEESVEPVIETGESAVSADVEQTSAE